uniref:Uncharacterized protein n=1 Tax=Anguilla anguilla TaxID=7936 RepID=A0A0E9S680_ANGAN
MKSRIGYGPLCPPLLQCDLISVCNPTFPCLNKVKNTCGGETLLSFLKLESKVKI